MNDPLIPGEIEANPLSIANTFQLASGAQVTVRLLLRSDSAALGAYFLGLSEETRRRFGPHPLDQATADDLCATISIAEALRLVAVVPGPAPQEIIAYFILLLDVTEDERARYTPSGIALDSQTDCTVAPSVADCYQSSGLGSRCFEHLIELARRLGRQRMLLLGGTQASNQRAIHFYAKHRFRTIGSFEEPVGVLNYDMLLELYEGFKEASCLGLR
jgi:GNAT superfamily N-acetyltransferase